MFWRACVEPTNGLWDCGRFVSYGDVWAQGDALVAASGCRDKCLACLFVDNSASSIAAYLGFLRGGHTVFLGDRRQSAASQRAWVERYRPDVVVGPAFTPGDEYQRIDCGEVTLHVSRRRLRSEQLHPELALLLATSGSMGDAKLVRLSYRGVQANAESIAEVLAIEPHHVAVTSVHMSYAYGLSVVNSHLARGASVVCTNRSLVDKEFWREAKQHDCTSLAGVPAQYRLLRDIGYWHSPAHLFQSYTQAGGSLAPDLQDYHLRHAEKRGARFVVMYGQTEATARISCVPPTSLRRHIGSIGLPIPGGRMSLRDPAPESGIGELVYEGANVMLGYANGPACLSKGDELGGILRTGDLARIGPDGYFWWEGRLARIVKPHGVRVSLDYLERRIERQTGHSAVAVGDHSENVAVFVEGGGFDAGRLARDLAEEFRLPESFIRFETVESIPVSDRGKIDHVALSALETRRVVTAAWTEVLGQVQPGPHDPFSGDSLQALELLCALGERGLDCAVDTFFANPTIAGMTEALSTRATPAEQQRPAGGIPPGRAGPLLSDNQRFWWALQRWMGDAADYHVSLLLELKGELDLGALQSAVNTLIERHEILRTRYVFVDGRLGPVVDPARAATLAVVDLELDDEVAVKTFTTGESCRPFDLEAGPVLRASLVRRGDGHHLFLLVVHHIACDGWSREILASELAVAYNAHRRSAPVPLPPPELQYADHVLREPRARLQLPQAAPRVRWPDAVSRPPRTFPLGGAIRFELDPELTSRLRELGRRHRATLYMILLGAFHVRIWQCTGQPDFAIGSPRANRTREALGSLVGCVTDTPILRLASTPEQSFAEFLSHVRSTVVAALGPGTVTLEQVRYTAKRGAVTNDWFQVMFILQVPPRSAVDFDGLVMRRLRATNETLRCDVTLCLEEHPPAMRGSWLYNTDRFAHDTAQDMVDGLLRLLGVLCEHPHRPLSELPLGPGARGVLPIGTQAANTP